MVFRLSESAMTKTLLRLRRQDEPLPTRTATEIISTDHRSQRERFRTLLDIRFSRINIIKPLVQFAYVIRKLIEPLHIKWQRRLGQSLGGSDAFQRSLDSFLSDFFRPRGFQQGTIPAANCFRR